MDVGSAWVPSIDVVASLKVAIALAGAGLLAWEALARRRGGAARSPARDAGLAALAGLAVLAFFDFRPHQRLGAPHHWELYHHYVGGKYFRELGYTRLYACTVVADAEDDFEPIPVERRPVRRLDTNEITTAAAILAEPDACRRHFTPPRWEAFRADLRWFRPHVPPRRWAQALTDHGFNATPAWMILGSALAAGPLSDARARALALLDPLLLAAMWAALFAGFGWRPACAALIFWGTNHPAQSSWMSGAYLRQDWLAAAAIGLALLRRDRPAAGGAALAVATLLRVFPGFLVAVLALRSALGCVRRRSLRLPRDEARFAVVCAATLAVGVALSTAATGRLGAWGDFAANSVKHFATPHVNFMGLPAVLAFDPDTGLRQIKDRNQPDPYHPWHEAARANLSRRAPWRWGAVLAFVALLGVAASREPPWAAAILGTGLVVVAASIGCYYYALLLVYGLRVAPGREWVGVGLLGLSAATWAIASSPLREEEVFVAESLACAAYVWLVTLAAARGAQRA